MSTESKSTWITKREIIFMSTESKSTWITKQEISVMSTILLALI